MEWGHGTLKKVGLTWYTDGSKKMKALEPEYMAMAPSKDLASTWGGMPQYFRLR
jgi:hypothetical protein